MVMPRIELGSGASETLILSIVLHDRKILKSISYIYLIFNFYSIVTTFCYQIEVQIYVLPLRIIINSYHPQLQH